MQEHKQIKTILVVRNDRFGEFLLNIPAMRALKESFPGSRIIALVDPSVRELAGCVSFIDEIMDWSAQKHSWSEKMNLINLLKKKNIDLAVMLNPSKELNICTYFARIPLRAGYSRKWGFLLNRKIKDKKHLGLKHEVEYNLELVNRAGAFTRDLSLALKVDQADAEGLLKFSSERPLVALHPWTSDPLKQWPSENFLLLAKKLLEIGNFNLVIVGGVTHSLESRMFDDLGENSINLTGKTNLRQLAALLGKCSLLISGDSGPVHLAACVGTPVLALFRTDLSGKTAKRWGPWGKGHAVIERGSLLAISVEEVFNKAKGDA